VRAGILLILLLAKTLPVTAEDGCFPPEAALDDFRADWYCKNLKAAELRQLGAGPTYRFIYLPTFHAPRFATVAMEPDVPVVRGVVLSGRGGYEPGKVAKATRRVLTQGEWQLLQQRLENAGIWEPPDTDDRPGTDGSRWVLEGRDSTRYRLHDLWSPKRARFPQYVKACMYMLDLAGIRPEAEELSAYGLRE
jgi:hypothetical protein